MSQVDPIRPILFSHPISNLIRKLLNHADTGVSFLSIGYFSFLLTYLPENDWDWHGLILKTTTRQLFCKHMEEIMDGWNEALHIKCYLTECSFNSALRLIQLANETAVQIWCLFAIQNYLQTNSENKVYIISGDLNETLKRIQHVSFNKVNKLTDYLMKSLRNSIIVLD